MIKFAKYIGSDFMHGKKLIAKTGDLIEIHAKDQSSVEYVAKGSRDESYFWVDWSSFEFCEDLDKHDTLEEQNRIARECHETDLVM